MFGEKPIVGSKIIKLDAKGRLVLPMFTGAENYETDFVITRISPIEGIVCLQIQKAAKFNERIAELKALRDNIQDLVKAEEAYQELVKLCLDTSAIDASVDGQRRMLLPTKLRKDVFGTQTEIACQGAYDSLYLFPSEELLDEFNSKRK